MKNLLTLLLSVFSLLLYAQNNDTINIGNELNFIQVDSTSQNLDVRIDTARTKDTTTNSEAKIFIEDTKVINDSIDSKNERAIVSSEDFLDTTKPYGIKFIKEFEMSGGTYHYLIMDAQHHEKLLHKPKWAEKTHHYDYEDLIVKLEYRGDNMTLYSIVFSEQIIGSLERLEKNYFVTDGKNILRVQEKVGHHHFFKEFERLYLDDDDSILKGKKFKNVLSLVKYCDTYSPETVANQKESNKYEVIH